MSKYEDSSPVSELVQKLRARCSYGDVRLWQKHDPLSEEAAAHITALEAENARLREALKPLKVIADAVFYFDGDREMNASRANADNVWGFDNAYLTYGDLRAARAILSLAPQGGDHGE